MKKSEQSAVSGSTATGFLAENKPLVDEVIAARRRGASAADLLRLVQRAFAPRFARPEAILILRHAFNLTVEDAMIAGAWHGWDQAPDELSDVALESALAEKLKAAADRR